MHKNEKEILRSVRRGFTLIELLVVVAIIGILGTIVVPKVNDYLDQANETAARSSVRALAEAVTAYKVKHNGKMPTALTQLTEESGDDTAIIDGGDDALIDPWGNEYKYELNGKRFCVISAGADGDFGTEDDIRSDKLNNKKKK